MSVLKERLCIIQAEGCQKHFQPKRFWQRVCNNPACQKEYHRRYSKKWRQHNPGYVDKYNKVYAAL